MHEVTREISVGRQSDWLVAIGFYDADLPPAHMIFGRIQDQKQKYNFEWPKGIDIISLGIYMDFNFAR